MWCHPQLKPGYFDPSLWNNLRNDNAENLANKIIALAVEVKKRVANVAISGIVFRADLEIEHKRKRVNYLVEVGLKDYGIDFISQDNIKAAHLDKWGPGPPRARPGPRGSLWTRAPCLTLALNIISRI